MEYIPNDAIEYITQQCTDESATSLVQVSKQFSRLNSLVTRINDLKKIYVKYDCDPTFGRGSAYEDVLLKFHNESCTEFSTVCHLFQPPKAILFQAPLYWRPFEATPKYTDRGPDHKALSYRWNYERLHDSEFDIMQRFKEHQYDFKRVYLTDAEERRRLLHMNTLEEIAQYWCDLWREQNKIECSINDVFADFNAKYMRKVQI